MSKSIIPIIDKDELYDGYLNNFKIGELSILLIQENKNIHVIENKCGHFGVELSNGEITKGTIICYQHGISFNLKTGAIENRPQENCGPIVIFDYLIEDNIVCIILDD